MMSVSFEGKMLTIGDKKVPLAHAIREAFALEGEVIVLLDPDSYLTDPSYGRDRRRGEGAIRNLIAVSAGGERLWEAEFPEPADYYYRIVSRKPLTALSFSSHRCEIDPRTGRIVSRQFLK